MAYGFHCDGWAGADLDCVMAGFIPPARGERTGFPGGVDADPERSRESSGNGRSLVDDVKTSTSLGRRHCEIFYGPDLVRVSVLDAGFFKPKSAPGFEGHGLAPVCDLQRGKRGKHRRRMAVVVADPARMGGERQ